MKKWFAALILVVLCAGLLGCGQQTEQRFFSLDDLDRANLGVVSASTFESVTKERWPEAELSYYNTTTDVQLALSQGKIDGFVIDEPMARYIVSQTAGLTYLREMIEQQDYAWLLQKSESGEALRAEVNEFLAAIEADGTLAEIDAVWFGSDEEQKTVLDYESLPAERGTIRLATSSTLAPFAYLKDGRIVGYDIDLVARFCQAYGYALEVSDLLFESILSGIQTGRYDLAAGGIGVTEERAEVMLFSEPTYSGGLVAMVQGYELPTAEDLADYQMAKLEGSIFDELFAQTVDIEKPWLEYKSIADGVAMLQSGKIDGMGLDEPVGRSLTNQNPNLYLIPGTFAEDHYGFAFQKGSALVAEFDSVLTPFLAGGTLSGMTYEQLTEKWLGAGEKTLAELNFSGCDRGTVRVGADVNIDPMSYAGSDGRPTGLEIELIRLICRELGYQVEFEVTNFGSLIPGLESDKYDLVTGCLSITEERLQAVDFSVSHYTGGAVAVVRRPGAVSSGGNFFTDIAESFERNFIRENRWMLIVQGLGTTVLISVAACLLGTLIGFGICLMKRSRNKVVSAIARVYIRLLQGTPVMVLLMILYYVVFGSTSISALWVSIIGFGLNFGAYVSEMMRTGIEAVDPGQIEAAKALGYGKVPAFFKITFPQAARHFLPVYKGEFISMVKMTSVVGYIAVQDLTKMSDIIRSRTYEAFFPLIVTAILYFLLAWVLSLLLNLIEVRVDPKHRKRKLKGVKA